MGPREDLVSSFLDAVSCASGSLFCRWAGLGSPVALSGAEPRTLLWTFPEAAPRTSWSSRSAVLSIRSVRRNDVFGSVSAPAALADAAGVEASLAGTTTSVSCTTQAAAFCDEDIRWGSRFLGLCSAKFSTMHLRREGQLRNSCSGRRRNTEKEPRDGFPSQQPARGVTDA